MALQKTKVLNITSVTGIATVGILTAGVTPTDAGVAGTCYIRSVIMHNTGLGTARVSLYINPDTNPVSIAVTTNRILRIDVAPNETTFFESNYPITLTSTDSLGVEVGTPDAGGVGIGSAVNFLVNGDTDIS
jgi:hypothetical protein